MFAFFDLYDGRKYSGFTFIFLITFCHSDISCEPCECCSFSPLIPCHDLISVPVSRMYPFYSQIVKKWADTVGGCASFGTFYSGEYYSSIYEQYGIDNVWGMMKNEHSFIADTYYPSLAQFGITGVILYALFWFYLLSKAFRFYRQSNNAKEFILFLLIICYFVIESIADSTYTTHRGFFIMMLLGLISSSMKTEIKNIKADENFTNR